MPGLTTYNVGIGLNYEGKQYSAVIAINHIFPKMQNDFIADGFNIGNSRAVRAHEIIRGLQIATRQLLIPLDPTKQNGQPFKMANEKISNDFEKDAYKTQSAYDKHR